MNTNVKKSYFFLFWVWLSAAELKIKFWLKRKISFVAVQYSLPKTRPILKRVSALRSQYTSMGVDTQRNTEANIGCKWALGAPVVNVNSTTKKNVHFPKRIENRSSIQMSTTSLKNLLFCVKLMSYVRMRILQFIGHNPYKRCHWL